jgi:hypothetical protein
MSGKGLTCRQVKPAQRRRSPQTWILVSDALWEWERFGGLAAACLDNRHFTAGHNALNCLPNPKKNFGNDHEH